MLKALELVGFKSFADRTRFEFPPGITAVVGPNGSGKSNIVDAVKWVLGEQSIKSLRGRETTDVIFNGSGTRRPMNSAEVTLVFDNATRWLPFDASEVSLTRRVYRGGEGEYLINRTPARLRDLRDLILGTGLGTHAYCVIEQGKVDALLQASPRDRRMIFEEAAGISRFRGRKTEALRRLERVGQNLLRLHDIVEEIDHRLKGLRAQAGKARRYREYAQRLQELRTQVARLDYRRLSAQIDERRAVIADWEQRRDEASALLADVEQRVAAADTGIEQLQRALQLREAEAADYRAQIAALEAAVEHDRQSLGELERETIRHRKQLLDVSIRAGGLQQQMQSVLDEKRRAEQEHQRAILQVAEAEQRLRSAEAEVARWAGEVERCRRAAHEQTELATHLQAQYADLRARNRAARERYRQFEQSRSAHASALVEAEQTVRQIEEQVHRAALDDEQAAAEAAQAQAIRDQLEKRRTDRQHQWNEKRQRLAASAERRALLEELERRQEGVGAGVKFILSEARNGPPGPWSSVVGMLADVIRVDVPMAPLIEAALGPSAQFLVVLDPGDLRQRLLRQPPALGGRVGLLWIRSGAAGEPTNEEITRRQEADEIERMPQVLGRADRFVETDPPYQALIERLLGQTYFVRSAAAAVELAEIRPDAAFIAEDGTSVFPDGTVQLGPLHFSPGLISRKSELRALTAEIARSEDELSEIRHELEELSAAENEARREVDAALERRRATSEALAHQRAKLSAAQAHWATEQAEFAALEQEAQRADALQRETAQAEAQAELQWAEASKTAADRQRELAQCLQHFERCEAERRECERAAAEARVELAKCDERLRNLQSRITQLEEHDRESRKAVCEKRDQLLQTLRREEHTRRKILQAESQIAELYLLRDRASAEQLALADQRDQLRRQRADEAAEAQRLRAKLRKLEERVHTEQLAEGELRTQRDALADRVREEYGLELAEADANDSTEAPARDAAQEEIEELRRKINSLGNVNLESLDELDALESRYRELSEQYDDLVKAKASLERIIQRINIDSRRLFTETLESVRGHFQTLFRDLFGGGQADIVLEDGVDILESGIEIVARPPGKELRSISLLSGGEKTLTCVALLLAIFRSRPSPFCVLDEVDAALDEANIDRFTRVLKDFLAWTQFIIVTHSKKTMTAADTLYGVTMQESGVSRQVSVRFEDVRENGEIAAPEKVEQKTTRPTDNRVDNSAEPRAA